MTHAHPTRDDRVVAALSEGVGGPLGDHAGRHPWWTPTRVLLLMTAVVFALGMVQKAPCSLAEGKDQNWTYSHMCYSDLRPLYVPRGLAEHAWPYSGDEQTRDRYEVMEYPAVIAYWAWGASWATHLLNGAPDLEERYRLPVDELHGLDDVQRELDLFVLVNAVGFGALALLSVWLLARVNPGRPWDAAAFALSPALLLTGLINWDLPAVALVAGALLAWSRDKPLLTGILIGLGTATKLYPLFLLGGVLILVLRQRRYGAGVLAFLGAAAAWALANAPGYLTGREQWEVFWQFNAGRGPDLGSLWLVADQAGDLAISAHTVNVWSWILFGAWCVGVFVLGMCAPGGRRCFGRLRRPARNMGHPDGVAVGNDHTGVAASSGRPAEPSESPARVRGGHPRLAQLGFLVVAGFLIVNKVYSPQYVLWLLPLAVLARPRWRDQIVWQAGEVFYFCAVWWYLGGYLNSPGDGEPGFYWVAIVVRVMAELYLCAVIVRDMFRPERDPVAPDQPSIRTRSNVVAV